MAFQCEKFYHSVHGGKGQGEFARNQLISDCLGENSDEIFISGPGLLG